MSRAAYDEIADWYEENLRSGPLGPFHELVVPALLDLAGDVRELKVCDLACGQGIVTRRLAERGASVVGVDISTGMLDLARRHERAEPRGITYLQEDAQSLAAIRDASFDGVVCNLALMDISDLEACARAVERVLRARGWFVFSITHPCFQTPDSRWCEEEPGPADRLVRAYFSEGFYHLYNEGVRSKVGAHHRTLSTYANTLSKEGLHVEHLEEPRATGRTADLVPGYREVPSFLIARCEKWKSEDRRS